MKLHITGDGDWAGTQDQARKLARERGTDWNTVDVPTDKPGLIAWLNENFRHTPHPVAASEPGESEFPPIDSKVGRLDDETFTALPLAHQLHLAALAVENAREKIKP